MGLCVWRDRYGWHRSLLHMWRRGQYMKHCVRCGAEKALVF